MALLPGKKETFLDTEILKETANLDKREAIAIQQELVNSWEPTREVWSLKYGSYAIGLACSISSVTINGLFKRKLRLRYTGEIFTTFCLAIGPAALAIHLHDSIITSDILLYAKKCPVCYELQACMLSNANALLYPSVLSPAITLAVAGEKGLRIPYIYEYKEVAKFWWNVIKPALNRISFLFCMNSFVASVVVYKQLLSADKMANIIERVRQYVEQHET